MKKLLLVLSLSAFLLKTNAQILVQYDFTGYDGTVPSIAPGWFISDNDTGSFKTFYTSSGNCGVSCPAYKFANDSDYIISPVFNNATQVQFYLKGNGTANPYNTFFVYGSPNGSTWTLIQSINPISASAATIIMPFSTSYTQLKFYYEKDSAGYNAGIDDIYISNGPVGINATLAGDEPVSVYPSPTNGIVNIGFNEPLSRAPSVKIVDVLGSAIKGWDLKKISAAQYSLDLSGKQPGFYFLIIQTEKGNFTRRITMN